jgi:SAM-dependent MidA family methyltransferase
VSQIPQHRGAAPTQLGHPQLIAAIVEEIRKSGPISFARFMELALYHPLFGYYMRTEDKADAEQPRTDQVGEDRLGWDGDFYTSADVHPVLAQSLAKQIVQMDEVLGHPDPFMVIEMGAGKGVFARDILTACEKASGSLLERLRYVIIERSPAMQASQQKYLAPWAKIPGRVAWLTSLAEVGTHNVVGVLFSNELVDAFSIHRIQMKQGQPQEVFVDYEDGRFCERLRPFSTTALAAYLERLGAMGVTLAEGAYAEINVQALTWIQEVACVLQRGFVVTIDYGHTAQDLYGPVRQRGTLLCYYHHTASEDPYQRVGLQDMTAHVDFTSLATVGEEHGLHVTGFTNQMSFLMGWGVEEALSELEPGSAEFQSIVQLLRPEGMGRTFKILIQHKGIEEPVLDGLRFKPFFGSVLAGTAQQI